MKYETDVLIVGGGPAGLATAIAVRQKGLRATVVDAALPPIDKACGEGLMPDSLQALVSLGVKLDGVETGVFRGIRFVGEDSSVEAKFPNGVGLGIRRTLLHEILIQRAEQMGVEFAWATTVETRSQRLKLRRGFATKVSESRDESPVEAKYRWLVGADGHGSQIRKFARLDTGNAHDRRVGLRRHFQVTPWSDLVEIYWAENCQAYVTPIAKDQICVALISRERGKSFDEGLEQFPRLQRLLTGRPMYSTVRGAMTVTRRLSSVTNGRIALVGEASGSVDAITGEGLAMCFRQAVALADAFEDGDLAKYEREHRKIMSLPQFMGRAMLLMDKSPWIQKRTLRALSERERIFDRMLSVHVGALPFAEFGIGTALEFGWGMLAG